MTSTDIAAHQVEALLFFTLLQLTVIVLAARIGGAIAIRIGQRTCAFAGRPSAGIGTVYRHSVFNYRVADTRPNHDGVQHDAHADWRDRHQRRSH